MKNFFKVLALVLVVCYILLSSIFQENRMVVAYRRPSVDFFTNCYKELGEAHETGGLRETTALFRAVRPEIERWLRSYWGYKWRFVASITVEDILQEGFFSIAKYMQEYKYVCSVCGNGSESKEQHDNHCKQEHGIRLGPKVFLSVYLSLNAMGRMRNVLRGLEADKRNVFYCVYGMDLEALGGLITVQGSSHISNPHLELLSKRRLGRFKKRVNSETVPKVRVYMDMILSGGTEVEAYQKIVDLGLTETTESARGSINYYKKYTQKIDGYKMDLEG